METPTNKASQLTAQDLAKAKSWGLSAAYLEEKTGESSLYALAARMFEEKKISSELSELMEWALNGGGSVPSLEQKHPGILFDLARLDGAAKVWDLLLTAGYSKSRVSASFKDGAIRNTSKLGLLCSPPYCFSSDLSSLIRVLIAHGIDPNERDSEGSTPLGRLNDQMRLAEQSKNPSIEPFRVEMLRAGETLLSMGADPNGILPLPEFHAAACFRPRMIAALEQKTISEEIIVPDSDARPWQPPISL